MWLAHHWPGDLDRCVVVGSKHFCRRCLVLYPTAFVTAVLFLVTSSAGQKWALALLVLAPIPTVGEWVGEHLFGIRHRPSRLAAFSVAAGAGLGVGFARYLQRPGDVWFWSVVLGYGGLCAATALLGGRSVGPGDAAQIQGIGDGIVSRHDADGESGTSGAVETQLSDVSEMPLVAVADELHGGHHAGLEGAALPDGPGDQLHGHI